MNKIYIKKNKNVIPKLFDLQEHKNKGLITLTYYDNYPSRVSNLEAYNFMLNWNWDNSIYSFHIMKAKEFPVYLQHKSIFFYENSFDIIAMLVTFKGKDHLLIEKEFTELYPASTKKILSQAKKLGINTRGLKEVIVGKKADIKQMYRTLISCTMESYTKEHLDGISKEFLEYLKEKKKEQEKGINLFAEFC
jgi:hypothetical protein